MSAPPSHSGRSGGAASSRKHGASAGTGSEAGVQRTWRIPDDNPLVAWVVGALAAGNAVLAAVAAFRHERRFRSESVYRTRFRS